MFVRIFILNLLRFLAKIIENSSNQIILIAFFKEKKATETEAEKFYNHFQSNGWLVGGKSKMKDWKAAARNWLLNANKFKPIASPLQPNHLHTKTNKNYGEPL